MNKMSEKLRNVCSIVHLPGKQNLNRKAFPLLSPPKAGSDRWTPSSLSKAKITNTLFHCIRVTLWELSGSSEILLQRSVKCGCLVLEYNPHSHGEAAQKHANKPRGWLLFINLPKFICKSFPTCLTHPYVFLKPLIN